MADDLDAATIPSEVTQLSTETRRYRLDTTDSLVLGEAPSAVTMELLDAKNLQPYDAGLDGPPDVQGPLIVQGVKALQRKKAYILLFSYTPAVGKRYTDFVRIRCPL